MTDLCTKGRSRGLKCVFKRNYGDLTVCVGTDECPFKETQQEFTQRINDKLAEVGGL